MIYNSILLVIVNLIVGSSVLIYGVNLISSGIEKANAKTIKKHLIPFTKSVWSASIIGIIVTAITQSSTAIILFTVGLVNAKIISLSQAVGVIYGANIGTTITAQLMSFNLADASIPIVVAGIIIIIIFIKNKTIRSIGEAIIGLGLMFEGIKILNLSIPLIKESTAIYDLFIKYGHNPYFAVFVGMIITALVHSSSATVGLTIVLFNSQLISFETALGLTLGDNIGTCLTVQIAALTASVNAKRTAWAHTLYNIIGTVIALIFFMPFVELIKGITFMLGQDSNRLIANAHTIFNLLSAVIFLPLTKYYVKFIEWFIPEK